MIAAMTAEFLLFLVIGLGILLFEAHRQFNHPAYSRTPEDETVGDTKGDYIFSLAPSEIRNRSAYFSAELVYILVIVALYLLLTLNDAVNNVLEYIVGFRAAQSGDPALPAIATGAAEAAREVVVGGSASDIDKAAAPLVVSTMMVTALRFPFVRRLEVLLRSSAQRLFGIPWIPHRLRQKIDDASIRIEAVEAELEPAEPGYSYAERIARYRDRALAAGAPHGRTGDLASTLSKLAAYQLWVNELKIWPSQDFRSDFHFFRDLNDPLSDQINELLKDCDLVASSGDADPAGSAPPPERRRMQQELWELKGKQARELAHKVAAMMALYDQNSKWPEAGKPGARSLCAFLDGVRAKDEARVFQINVAILLLLISAAVSLVAGWVHAYRLGGIARDLGIFDGVGGDDPQFDRFRTARNFALSSLIVYGLSMWAALDIRRRMLRSGNWTNPFVAGRRIPPMGQLAAFFAAVAVIVFAVNCLYLLLSSPDWSLYGDRTEGWWANVRSQANLSVLFAVIGGFHGTAVAMMMDLGEKRVESRTWLLVAAIYIAVMMLLGYGLGYFHSLGSASPIRAMREMLYAVDLGLIALFTSISMILFLRPEPAATVPAATLGESAR